VPEGIYLRHGKRKTGANSRQTWNQIILRDFDDLEKADLTNPEIARIRELLKPGAK
jgi:hypothetical protein